LHTPTRAPRGKKNWSEAKAALFKRSELASEQDNENFQPDGLALTKTAHRAYTELFGTMKKNFETLTEELRHYRDTAENQRIAGAWITAAIKRYKTSHRIPLIERIAVDEDLDMTLPLARNLLGALFTSKPSSTVLHSVFATPGRDQGDRSADNCESRINDIVSKYKSDAESLDKQISDAVLSAKQNSIEIS